MGRRLGQHFLTDPRILDRIVAALDPAHGDVVLEVGAGHGSLTRRLARRFGRVVAVETDRALAQRWRATLAGDVEVGDADTGLEERVHLVVGDALRLDWHRLVAEVLGPDGAGAQGFKIVGNIPYAITTPLLDKALLAPLPEVIVFLVQTDVALRLAAQPPSKSYGALSVGVQVVAEVERLFSVRAGSFSPPPRVDSTVVRLVPLQTPVIEEEERAGFRRFVSAVFSQRRKQLHRILRSVLGWDADAVRDVLRALNVDPAARPETLSPGAFVILFRATRR